MPSSDATVVHLMRHGEVDNPGGVLYGRLPGFGLSERGHQMARAVAEHLADHDVVHVVASPLQRALQTAAPIAQQAGVQVTEDPRVVEAGNALQGRVVGTGAGLLSQPSTWRLLVNPFKPSWGEPYEQVAQRMLAAVADALQAARGHEAVVVSHQLPVWSARLKLEGRRLWHDPRKRQCTLASLTSLHFLGDQLDSIAYSEPAAHLLAGAATQAGA